MVRRALFVLILLILSSSGIGHSARSTPNEPEGTEALIVETRQLRKDLQTTNGYDSPPSFAGSGSAAGRVAQHLNAT